MNEEIAVISGELYVYVKQTELNNLRFQAEEYRRMRAAQMRNTLTEDDHKVWQDMGRNNQNVEAIKHIRTLLGCGLGEAKEVYDLWRQTGTVMFANS